MESRNFELTPEKAREWYLQGGTLKEISLQVFNEDELVRIMDFPKTWEEYCKKHKFISCESHYITADSVVECIIDSPTKDRCVMDAVLDKNLLPSKYSAEAHLALMQLHQLRDCYRLGWHPSYSSIESKSKIWSISKIDNDFVVVLGGPPRFLSFQARGVAIEFLNNYLDLIRKAGDLI